MDWAIFLPVMDEIRPDRTQEGAGGRPPFTNQFVIKALILKSLNNVSNDMLEFLINDRLTWKRFLGLNLDEKSPDANSFWTWEELLTNSGRYEEFREQNHHRFRGYARECARQSGNEHD